MVQADLTRRAMKAVSVEPAAARRAVAALFESVASARSRGAVWCSDGSGPSTQRPAGWDRRGIRVSGIRSASPMDSRLPHHCSVRTETPPLNARTATRMAESDPVVVAARVTRAEAGP